MRVLVYENNLFFVPRLQARLQELGHEVILASTPHETVGPKPDAVLVDLHAPDALGVIRQFVADASIKTIAFCGHSEVELRKQAKQAGVDVLLPNSELIAALPRVLPAESASAEAQAAAESDSAQRQ